MKRRSKFDSLRYRKIRDKQERFHPGTDEIPAWQRRQPAVLTGQTASNVSISMRKKN